MVHRYHNHGFFPAPVVRRAFQNSPEGMLPTMDDDTGAMSTWFVYSALGLFPFCPGEPYYVIGSPVFPEVTLALDPGRSFTIRAHNVSEENLYIRSALKRDRASCPPSRPGIEVQDEAHFAPADLQAARVPRDLRERVVVARMGAERLLHPVDDERGVPAEGDRSPAR
jgi:hypothetical protein